MNAHPTIDEQSLAEAVSRFMRAADAFARSSHRRRSPVWKTHGPMPRRARGWFSVSITTASPAHLRLEWQGLDEGRLLDHEEEQRRRRLEVPTTLAGELLAALRLVPSLDRDDLRFTFGFPRRGRADPLVASVDIDGDCEGLRGRRGMAPPRIARAILSADRRIHRETRLDDAERALNPCFWRLRPRSRGHAHDWDGLQHHVARTW